jgi:UDP-3-O-[3-hydroxymyristoyl] glucosamine N-acyltransferase
MRKFSRKLRPAEIAGICGGEYRGNAAIELDNVADPADADFGSVIFLEQDKYIQKAQDSPAGLVICPSHKAELLTERNVLIHPQPYIAILRLVSWWREQCANKPAPGIHPTAILADSAQIGSEVHIGPHVVISEGCKIGDQTVIEANCTLGNNVSLGKGTRLYPGVHIYEDTQIGTDCTIHSGTVLGADGFGYILHEGRQQKIPQIGNVVIGDYVEIGANSCIDRGTLSSTVIGEGTKIDNLVQIGHNCNIGKHCILCGQVGLAGNTVIKDYVYLAGQAGSSGHITIGEGAQIGAQSGVMCDVPAGSQFFWTPAREARKMKKILVSLMNLPELHEYYRKQQKEKDNKS